MGRPGPCTGKHNTAGRDEYASQADAERAVLKEILTSGLAHASGDVRAEMRWTVLAFRDTVLLSYGLLLVGWPRDIMFCNPSMLSVDDVQCLLDLYARHRLYFRRATAGDVYAARESLYNACPGLSFRAPPPETCRRNLGQRGQRPTVDTVKYPPRRVRNGPKSKRWIDSDSE